MFCPVIASLVAVYRDAVHFRQGNLPGNIDTVLIIAHTFHGNRVSTDFCLCQVAGQRVVCTLRKHGPTVFYRHRRCDGLTRPVFRLIWRDRNRNTVVGQGFGCNIYVDTSLRCLILLCFISLFRDLIIIGIGACVCIGRFFLQCVSAVCFRTIFDAVIRQAADRNHTAVGLSVVGSAVIPCADCESAVQCHRNGLLCAVCGKCERKIAVLFIGTCCLYVRQLLRIHGNGIRRISIRVNRRHVRQFLCDVSRQCGFLYMVREILRDDCRVPFRRQHFGKGAVARTLRPLLKS